MNNNKKRPPRLAQANTLRTQHQGRNGMPQPPFPPAGDDSYHNGRAKFILTGENIAKTSVHNNTRMPSQHPMSPPIMHLFIQIIILLAKVCFLLAMLEMTWGFKQAPSDCGTSRLGDDSFIGCALFEVGVLRRGIVC